LIVLLTIVIAPIISRLLFIQAIQSQLVRQVCDVNVSADEGLKVTACALRKIHEKNILCAFKKIIP
jgi:hypothetical protein